MDNKKDLSTKEKIFEAAVELFAEKGYHGTSVRDLARKVSIKESSLYNHFEGKEAILKAILDYQLRGFQKAVAALDQLKFTEVDNITDPVEFWMAGTSQFLKAIPPISDSINRILINEMNLNRDCRQFYLNTHLAARKKLVEKIFNVMKEKGMIKDIDIKKTAAQYVYMQQGLEIENRLRSMEGCSKEKIRKYFLEQLSLFIKGLKK